MKVSLHAAQASLKAPRGTRWGASAPPARYWSGADGRNTPETAPAASCRHLLCLPSQLLRGSRAETPKGSQSAFARGDLTGGLNPYPSGYTGRHSLLPPSSTRRPIGNPLAEGLPRGEDDGLTTFHGCTTDGLGSAYSPMARQRRQGKREPLHLAIYLLVQAYQRLWLA